MVCHEQVDPFLGFSSGIFPFLTLILGNIYVRAQSGTIKHNGCVKQR
jgi:hypothetical protein